MASYATWIQGILRISSSGRSGSTAQAYDLSDRTRETFPAALAQALRAAGIKGGEVYLATDTSLIVPSLEELPRRRWGDPHLAFAARRKGQNLR